MHSKISRCYGSTSYSIRDDAMNMAVFDPDDVDECDVFINRIFDRIEKTLLSSLFNLSETCRIVETSMT